MNLEDTIKKLEAEYAEVTTAQQQVNQRMQVVYEALQGAKKLLAYQTGIAPTIRQETEPANKTDAVLLAVSRRNGVTTADLHEALSKSSTKMTRQHLYNTLARLKEDGRIEKRGEQYFAIS